MSSGRNTSNEQDRAQSYGPLAIGSIIATIVSLIIVIVLIVWTAVSSGIFSLDANGEDGALKTALLLFILLIACGSLFVPMKRGWRPSNYDGLHDRKHLGILSASMFMVGNMFLVSFWYLVDLAFGEGEDDSTYQKATAYVSLLLAITFSIISICIYKEGKNLPETDHSSSRSTGSRSNNEAKIVQATSSAHLEMMSQVWNVISTATVAIFAMLFVAVCVSSIGEEAQRMREEGGINLIIILMWMTIIATGMLLLGRKILGENKLGSLGVGMLSGGTMYFALLLFTIFLLYTNITEEERRNEDGAWMARAIACAFFFLSWMHLGFSLGTYKYQNSIIESTLEKDTSSGLKMSLFSRKKNQANN